MVIFFIDSGICVFDYANVHKLSETGMLGKYYLPKEVKSLLSASKNINCTKQNNNIEISF